MILAVFFGKREKKKKMTKKLYRGTFNYAGEVYELYTHTLSPEEAFLNFCSQLSKKLHFMKRTVIYYFNGSKDNYYIEEANKKSERKESSNLAETHST